MSAAGKNLAVIDAALKQHDSVCSAAVTAIMMNPFEVERLGWDDYRGIPIKGDEKLGTGCFRLLCDGTSNESQGEVEEVNAVSTERELVSV